MLRTLEEVFEDRIRRHPVRAGGPGAGDALATVLPTRVEEVMLLAEVTECYSVPLIALGAETAHEPGVEAGGIVIRFDLMRGLKIPEFEEPWVEAELGVLWLEIDDNLRVRGRSLVVYPTSAPRSTVGGWLALDGPEWVPSNTAV
jgi:FAD/FMN-containing dehydrogenase